MFHVNILNERGQKIIGSLDKTASAADHFAGCVHLAVELLNGGSEINKETKMQGLGTPFKTTVSQQSAIVMFLQFIHDHAAFKAEKVLGDASHPNHDFFLKVAQLLKLPVNDTSTHHYFLELLKTFKITGISSIEFSDDFTEAQRNLYMVNFPDNDIPEEFLCTLSTQIMYLPCFDKRNPEQKFDHGKLIQACSKTGKNPYTNLPITDNDIVVDEELKAKIHNFMRKIISIPKLFPENYNEIYTKYQAEITGTLDSSKFKSLLDQEKSSTANKVSSSALIKKEQSENPMKLYEMAILNYKNNEFETAIHQLQQALSIFQEKTGNDSSECFKCYSALTSCYRNLKKYDEAIVHAHNTIAVFFGKTDLTSIIKKYEECLTLRGDNPITLYKEAVQCYKDKQYSVAVHQLLFAISHIDPTNLSELASCHSTLASCYRELQLYKPALEHCEQALQLRKQFLNPSDKLIQNLENKLQELNQLLHSSTLTTTQLSIS